MIRHFQSDQVAYRGGRGMNISAVNRTQSSDTKPKTDKMGVLLAQRAIETARQNQTAGGSNRTEKAEGGKSFAHPYLGHNVDIYV